MPTLRKLRDDFIAKAISLGVDNVGVTTIDPDSEVYAQVNKEAPGMVTALGLVMQIPEEAREMVDCGNQYVSAPYNYASYIRMHHIGIVMARWLEDMGYHASIYTSQISGELMAKKLKENGGKKQYFMKSTARVSAIPTVTAWVTCRVF